MLADWRPPGELPDLRRAGIISLDIETKDGGLLAGCGSAWPWGDGYICGISVAYKAEGAIRAHYFPLRHPDSQNFDHEQLFQWLRDLIASDVRIVTQNGLYDWGWLHTEANILMPPSERIDEIGALATIVDENRYRYSLEALCAWRGLPGKDETLLHEGCAALGLITNRRKKFRPQPYLWQLPAPYVGPYAEADTTSTLQLYEDLVPVLEHEGTHAAYRLEVDLLPMVLEMRRRGIRIDTAAAEQARDLLLGKRDAVLAELSEKLGVTVGMDELNRSAWRAAMFDQHGVKYPRTKKGSPSFTAGNSGWMPRHEHWLPQLIVQVDKLNNYAVNFLETYILGHVIRGRVHAEIHPHRSDEGGARSLRFSYSSPPLQLMPAHDEELAPLIRGVFLPEEGEVWAKPDLSQQEFRFIVHHAALHKLSKAAEAVERYRTDPRTDFHNFVVALTGLDRQSAKAVNFAKSFGAGVRKFATMIGKPEGEARAIYERYDRELPFVSQLSKLYTGKAKRQGYVTLYDGARRHFDSWEALGVAWTKGMGPCAREEAERRRDDPNHPWHRRWLRRAETHKAMNALIQGSAARHTKLWMRACWREGIVPLLQMHDALDCSVSSREQAERVAQLACEVVSLEVPMQVDLKFGRNWGDAKHTWEELGQTPPSPKQPTAATPELPTTAAPKPQRVKQTINGAKVYIVAAENPIVLPTPHLADLIDEPLIDGKVCCPFHDDHTPSCHIYTDHFHCFVCKAHGDIIDWLRDVDGLSYDAALELLASWQGPVSQSKPADDTLARALRLWKAAQPIAGTAAIQYLADVRGIDVAALPSELDQVLRFHPHCPFTLGARQPCLIALYRDVATDEPAGIHRIALTAETRAGGKVKRRMLGRWPTARAIKLWPAASRLFVGEGVETVLAAASRLIHRGAPMRPAWAAGSSNDIAKFPVLPGVDELVALMDYDTAGEAAIETCREVWRSAGRGVTRLRPQRPGTDFNDVVLEKLRAAP